MPGNGCHCGTPRTTCRPLGSMSGTWLAIDQLLLLLLSQSLQATRSWPRSPTASWASEWLVMTNFMVKTASCKITSARICSEVFDRSAMLIFCLAFKPWLLCYEVLCLLHRAVRAMLWCFAVPLCCAALLPRVYAPCAASSVKAGAFQRDSWVATCSMTCSSLLCRAVPCCVV